MTEISIGQAVLPVTGEVLYASETPSIGAVFLNQYDYCVDYLSSQLKLRSPRGEGPQTGNHIRGF